MNVMRSDIRLLRGYPGMISCAEKPQCGQVSTDSRTTAFIDISAVQRETDSRY